MADTDWSKFKPVAAPAAAAAPAPAKAPTAPAAETDWSQYTPAPQSKGLAGDLGRAVKAGFQRLPGAATGLVDIPLSAAGFDRPASRLADAAGEATGFQPGKWADETVREFSPQTKIAQREIDQAWEDPEAGALDVAGAYARNPRTTAINIAQSLPSIAAGGAVGRAAGAVGGFQSAAVRGAVGEGSVMAGQSMDSIDEEVDPQRAAAAAAASGVGGAALGYAGGRLAQRLGIADVDQLVAGGTRTATQAGLGMGRRVGAGVVQEGLLEEAPQSALETVTQNWAEGKDLNEGLARNMTEGALAGSALGGAVAALPNAPRAQDAELGEQGAPAAPVAPAAPAAPGVDGAPVAEAGPASPATPVPSTPPAPVEAVGTAPTQTPSQAMGLDPNAGPISAAAVQAVDGGATQHVQALAAAQEAAEQQQAAAKKPQAAAPAPSEPAQPPAPSGPRGSFADAQGAQDYIRQQRRAGGTSISALPIRYEDGSYGVAARGTPEYAEAEAQAKAAEPKQQELLPTNTAEAIKKVREKKAAAKAGAATPTPQPAKPQGASSGPQADQAQQATPQREEARAPATELKQPAAPVDVAAKDAATSPENDRPEPTQAQKEAGNYKVGRARISGLDISIENPQGSVRRGTASDGTAWETPMHDHYGYFRGTTAADGDKLDVFVKPATPEDFAGTVYVVDQVDPATGAFDEAKVVLGAADQAEAEAIYRRNYSAGWQGLGAITALPMPAFKAWAGSRQTRKPLGALPAAADVTNASQPAAAPAPETAPAQAPAPARGDGAAAAPVPDSGGAADAQAAGVSAPADAEIPAAVHKRRAAALERIAKGTAYFGSAEKAEEFIAKSGLKDTHEWHEAKPGRFEVRAKGGAETAAPAGLKPMSEIRSEAHAAENNRQGHPSSQDNNLITSLFSFSGAVERWERARQEGRTDAQLKEEIGAAFGLMGGGPFANAASGGENPKFFHNADGGMANTHGKPTLSGAKLVSEVRRLLGIPQPVAEKPTGEKPKGESVVKRHERAKAEGQAELFPEGDVVILADESAFAEALKGLMGEDVGGASGLDEDTLAQVDGESERDRAMFRPAGPTVALPRVTAKNPQPAGLPFVSPEEAASRLQAWKDEADRQGREAMSANARRTVISLFDASGVISQPWVDAGYNVVSYDLQHGDDINQFNAETLLESHGNDEVWAILAQPPCTDFASSGAQWWKDKDADGRTEASNELVRQTLRTIELFRPPVWVMENPVGRIASQNNLPDPTLTFDPWAYGDPYTKRTQLWGRFDPNLPTAPVEPTEGSKIHKLSSSAKYERSLTPEGFAYALFMANNAENMSPADRLAQEFAGVEASLFRAAIDAGNTPEDVRSAIEDSYYESQLGHVREELQRLAGPTAPAPAPAPSKRLGKVIDNSATNPGQFLVRDAGHNLASFQIGANGRAVRIKHFFDSQQTRSMVADTIEDFLASREQPAASAPSEEKPAGIVGRRADGVMIREDERGVRWYTQDGVRHTETVSMRPTRQGIQIERGALKPDFMTAEELAASKPAAPEQHAASKPAAAAQQDSSTAPASEPRKPSKKAAQAQQAGEAERAEYFTPGNVVRGYAGFDEVLEYRTREGGGWDVLVHEVQEVSANNWVRVGRPQHARWHSTQPEPRNMKAGPVARLPALPADQVPYSDARAGGHPNAHPRGVAAAPAATVGVRRMGASGYAFPHMQVVSNVQAAFAPMEVEATAIGESDGYVNFGTNFPDGRYYIASKEQNIGFKDGQWGPVSMRGIEPQGTYDPANLEAETIRVLGELGAKRKTPAAAKKPAVEPKAPAAKAKKPEAAQTRAKADLMNALADLGDILGKGSRLNILPEQEQKLLPVLTRVLDAAFRLGYHKFKDAAKFALDQIRQHVGTEAADALTIDHLQGAYIAMAGGKQGVDTKRAVIDVESKAEIEQHEAQSVADMDSPADGPDTQETRGDNDAARTLDSPGPGALEGAPAQDVQGTAAAGAAGAAPARGGRGDQPGDAEADGAGLPAPRGLGSDARDVPVPARGGRQQRASASQPGLFGDAGLQRGDEVPGDVGRGDRRGEAGRVSQPGAVAPPAFKPSDFTIEEDFALGEGGQKTKYRNNVAAIRLLQTLDAEQRHATPDEQAVLARYVGWGGLPQAFDAENSDWKREHAELRELLSDDEYDAARRSTRYAHYTSRPIIQGMYDALKRFGFTGGKVLEPGAGVGNFMGLMPADLRSGTRMTGVERERIAAGIARHLYPGQNMQLQDFTQFHAEDGYFDAVIGNPPFAADGLVDQSGRKHLSGMAVHDYFFAKSVDLLREGGVFAAVVSNGFMDKAGDRARRYIGERTRLLGAIRLPNNAFAANANTEVTTDIVFLQKLPESEWGSKAAKADLKRWLDTTLIPDPQGGKPVAINQYFADHPEMMLGQYGRFGTMYGPDQPALVSRPGQDTAALLQQAVARLPEGVFEDAATLGTAKASNDIIEALRDPSVREGGHYVDDGKLYQRMPDRAGETSARLLTPDTQWTEKTTLGAKRHDRLVQLAGLRRTLRSLLAAELAGDARMSGLRSTLNRQYDAYVAEHGLINDATTAQVFDDDPDYPLLAALELNYTRGMSVPAAKAAGVKPYKSKADKAPIFERRVIERRQAVTKADTPEDALNVSLAERGRIDAGYIGELLGRPAEDVLAELTKGDKPALFVDPVTGEHVLRDAYLSGNVRKKLEQAKMAGLERNVRALMAVQPEDVGAHEISARIGAPWVPAETYEAFIEHLLGEGTTASVSYQSLNSSFSISVKPGSEVASRMTFGTPRMEAPEILSALLNNRSIRVMDTDSEGKSHLNKEATDAANEKASDIKTKFGDWIFADADRSEVLVRAYNDTNNNYVTRVFDGSRMEFPGKVPDDVIKFRRHQRNAIARIVQDRTALLDHVVGAGKTFTVVAGAMELRRTGLAKKPMVVVPNHLVKQWAADFYRLYPGANVLTATKKDFERQNRRRFLAKIATGDWDAVVIAHSSFGFIKPDADFEAAFNERQIAQIVAAIEEIGDDRRDKGKRRTVKQLEAMKERLENRIKALRDKPVDDLLDFKQIGVDQVFVDEAHLFKNLMFSTKMQNVQGLGDSKGSQRAYDMLVKTAEIFAQNGREQGVVFATGTPVSNTLAEMYHVMRYLMPGAIREQGFDSFDAWANTFASVDQVWMQKPSGDGYKASDRLASFNNAPELLKMYDQVADTVTMDDIKKAYAEENEGEEFPLPALKGDRRTPVSLAKSPAQEAYMEEIAKRALALEQRKGPPQKGQDNFLTIMSDARKAAMDVRLVDLDRTEREKGARIDRASDEVVARYRQFDAVKGTQLVFSDLGTPLSGAKKEMKEYEELRDRIAVGQDADVQADAALGDEAALKKLEDAEAAQEELNAKGADWADAIKAALRGFSVYDDFKAALIEKGIPAAEIAFIHDYNTDDQKAALYSKVKAGQIRVLMGSTPKLGAGTNVQDRLVALHHLDVPWKPSDVEQREGRIIRQGNLFATKPTAKKPNPHHIPGFEVEILAYVTQDTLDMRMWQTQEVKLKMINQLRSRQIARELENPFEQAEMSAGEMQAAATGNMDLLREIQLRADVKKLEQRKRSFDAQRNDLVSRRKRAERNVGRLPEEIAELKALAEPAMAYFRGLEGRPFAATINGKAYNDRGEAEATLRELVKAHEQALEDRKAAAAAAGEKAGAAFPEGSPERAGAALDARDAYTKANPAPKMAVEFNGKTYGSKTALGEAMVSHAGDREPIQWDVGGATYVRRAQIASAIEEPVVRASDTDTQQDVGTIGGFRVTVEGARDRMENRLLDVVLEREGRTADTQVMVGQKGDGRGQSEAVVRAVERLLSGLPDRLQFAEYDLSRAKRELADLQKADMPDAWPEQGKLDQARAAHKEVLQRLSATKEQPAPEDGDVQLSIDQGGAGPDTRDAHDAPSEAHRNAAAIVREGISARRRAAGGADVVLDAVAPRDGARNGRTAQAVAAVAQRLFHREVVFVRFQGEPAFNGAVSRSQPGRIFLNIDSDRPLMAVLGHELLHEMSKTRPQLYAALSERLDELIKGESTFAKRLHDSYTAQRISTRGMDAREELEADIVGDFFMAPAFWAELSRGRRGAFQEIVGFIVHWLRKTAARVGMMRPFGTEEFLSDINAARRAVASAMREFSDPEAQGGVVAREQREPSDRSDAGGDDVTLSIAATARQQIRQFDVRTKPANALKHYRGLGLQALGRRQLVELFEEELPQLGAYNRIVQVMDAEKNDTGAEADRLASAWGALDRDTKTKGEERRLAELMHDATLARIDPAEDYAPGDDRAAWEALRQRYEALQPAAREIYLQARDMYAAHYEKVRKAIRDRIERSDMSGSQKKAMMAKMDEDFFKKTRGVYFPLARFGNYVIVVRDREGEVVNVSRAETLNEAETTRKELQRLFPAAQGNTVGKVLKDAEFNPGRDAVGKGFMAELFAELDKRGVDMDLRDSVSQLYLASLPDLSWAKHGIHRKGTPGFSQDARRAFAQNMFHGARYLAKLRHADKLQTLLQYMQEHADAYKHIEEYDSVKAQQVIDEMVKRHENLMNPKASALSTALTSIGFVFYLGVSPAAAMVNLSQTALVAYPIMGAKWGFNKSASALLKASAEVVRAKNDISKVLRGDELDAYNRAVSDGTIDVTMAHDLAGISQGEDAKVTWALRPVMRVASYLFHHAERFNRQATFLAAYRLARGTGVEHRAAFEQAKQATYEGHFDYGASNRPRLMQGNVAKVVTLFKQYGQNMVYTLSRQAYLSVKGLSKADRAQARKVLGGILASHAMAAGTLGLPIVGPLLAAASFLGGDDDEPWDAEVALQNAMADVLGPKAAEVLAHGLSRLTPWDISSRVALDKLILPDVQEGLEGQRWAESYMTALVGPVAGIGTGIAKGLQDMSEGKYQRGLESMLPVALRNLVKAARLTEEGAVDRSGVVIKDEVGVAGLLGQAAGFAPSEVRRATEGRMAIYAHDRARMERRQVLMNQFAEARMSGDEEGVAEAREAIARFNEKNPQRRITPPQLARSVRARQLRIDRSEQGVYLPRNRRDALEAGRFAVE